jgi:hypothetical protein
MVRAPNRDPAKTPAEYAVAAATAVIDAVANGACASDCEAGPSGYRDALVEAELAAILLRLELKAVERAWAEENAFLHAQLARKDETIWQLAQQSMATPPSAALVQPGSAVTIPQKPPRIGHRVRPTPIPMFQLRASGAMVTTPPKRVLRARNAPPKPSWNSGHTGGAKAFGKRPQSKVNQTVSKPAKAPTTGTSTGKGTKSRSPPGDGAKKRKPSTNSYAPGLGSR